jgi:hypothetical protein
VWHVLGADPQQVSARSAAQRLDQSGHASHLVWNPCNGEIVQLIPIVRAAQSLAWLAPAGIAPALVPAGPAAPGSWPGDTGAAQVHAEGRVCVQVCVVAFAHEPFTDGVMAGRREIMDWLDSWDIPRCWPAGRPAPFPDCHATERSRRLWARGGHFGASQVPGLAAGGPGAIDPGRLTGWLAPAHSARPATRPLQPVAAAGNVRAAGGRPASSHPGSGHPGGRDAGHGDGERPRAGYDPPDIGELLGGRAGVPATLAPAR